MYHSQLITLSLVMIIINGYASQAAMSTGTKLILIATPVVTKAVAATGFWAWCTGAATGVWAGFTTFATEALSVVAKLAIGTVYAVIGGVVIYGIWYIYDYYSKNVTVDYLDEDRNNVTYQAIKLDKTQKNKILSQKGNIEIDCFHVSCKSDHPGNNKNVWYAIGIVLYSYHGKSQWKLNGIRCKSGYIVLISTDKVKAFKQKHSIRKTFHNTAFKMIFGKFPSQLKYTLIAGGFSVQKGKNVYNSATLNVGNGNNAKYEFAERDTIHFGTRVMNPLEQKYIAYAADNWIKKKQQNTKVSSVPSEGYILCVHPDYIKKKK